MGATASNISEETAKALVQISNTATQSCMVSDSEIQQITINGITGSNLNIVANLEQSLVLNSDCLQSDTVQNSVQQAMAQKANQLAKAIAQQYELSAAEADNLAQEIAQMSTQISNSFRQNCSNFGAQVQSFTLENGSQLDATIYLNFDQYNASVTQCVSQDAAVNNSFQSIAQTTQQTASATVQNFLAGILAAIFGILAIIGLVFFSFILFGYIGTHGSGSKAAPQITVQAPQDI